jgi:hypothetical protein
VVCKTDEVGEICMNSGAIGSAYWGLPGLTNTTFKVKPLPEEGSTTPWETDFVRTGLLGFLGPVSQTFLRLVNLRLVFLRLVFLRLVFLRLVFLRLVFLRLVFLRLVFLRLVFLRLVF